uniref:Uncharacterized protein At1g04910 isoform X2 n=1 Tax=Rhizophora mucronata TaxID=61149 RepID=A0A2P2IMS9_RHIMU
MGHFCGISLQKLFECLMRNIWDSQLIGQLFQISRRKKITFMLILKSAFAREQSVTTYLALLTQLL